MNLSAQQAIPLTERNRKLFSTLARRKGRLAAGRYLIEGRRLLASALSAGAPVTDIVVTLEALGTIESMPQGARPTLWTAPPADLDRITDVRTHQGIVGLASLPDPDAEISESLPRYLVLDGVQDPGNVGTLIRSAAWFGFNAVIAGPGTADFFAPKVVRSTMGGLWDVGLYQTEDLSDTLLRLADAGVEVWSADMDGIPHGKWPVPERLALVVGSEAHGVTKAVSNRCSGRVVIPRAGLGKATESLNVTAAAAVLLARSAQM